jgi:hypothetical protein
MILNSVPMCACENSKRRNAGSSANPKRVAIPHRHAAAQGIQEIIVDLVRQVPMLSHIVPNSGHDHIGS